MENEEAMDWVSRVQTGISVRRVRGETSDQGESSLSELDPAQTLGSLETTN